VIAVLLVVVGPARPDHDQQQFYHQCPSPGTKTSAVAAFGLPSELGDSSAVDSGRAGQARPRPTALLSPSSDGKPEAATAVVVVPDDGHENARNMLNCI